MITVVKIIGTCPSNPSQWEGRTSDGYNIYIRYRWGHLIVSKSEEIDGDAVIGKEIFAARLGDPFDGKLSYRNLREVTQLVLDLPKIPYLGGPKGDFETGG